MIPLDVSDLWATMAGGCQAISKRNGRTPGREESEKKPAETRARDNSAHGNLNDCDWRITATTPNDPAGSVSDKGSEAAIAVLIETRGDKEGQHPNSALRHTGSDIGARLDMFTTIIPAPSYPFFGREFESDSVLPAAGRPENFGVVVPGVYRSSYPQAQDYTFIKDLKLRTIVTLVDKEFPESYRSFITENGIRHHVFNMKGTKKEEIPMKTMRGILRLVLNHQNHPLLIHCNHGKHRTGCVVAVVRKVTGWELPHIVDEYTKFAGAKVRDCDVKYITAFDLSGLSNLFAERSAMQFRTRTFTRITILTLCAMIIWFISGFNMNSAHRFYPRPSPYY